MLYVDFPLWDLGVLFGKLSHMMAYRDDPQEIFPRQRISPRPTSSRYTRVSSSHIASGPNETTYTAADDLALLNHRSCFQQFLSSFLWPCPLKGPVYSHVRNLPQRLPRLRSPRRCQKEPPSSGSCSNNLSQTNQCRRRLHHKCFSSRPCARLKANSRLHTGIRHWWPCCQFGVCECCYWRGWDEGC